MSLDRLMRQRISNIRAFNELPIDADVWRQAHHYHRHHRQLHALAAHRPGIVCGLEVVASTRRPCGVVIAPGIAVDSEGQTIVLRDPVTFTITEPRQVYLVLRFDLGIDRESEITIGSGVDYFREIEGREVDQTDQQPRPAQLELARIFRSGLDCPVQDAADPVRPRRDEINLLHRCPVFPVCHADLGVGELPFVPRDKGSGWSPTNRAGVIHLLREAGAAGFHLWFTGPANLHSSIPSRHPGLLYLAGKGRFTELSEREREGLRNFLQEGGVLLAEPASGCKEFEASFRELAARMKWRLRAVDRGHHLLLSHHVFAAPPPGGRPRGEVEADEHHGVIFSTFDYGAAWEGQLEDHQESHSPERLRSAIGFGLNVAAYAAQRARRFELSRLE